MAKPNVINKEILLDAANECLVEQGIQGFTLRAVAETAGVTQGTVYYHFRTKEQLLIEMAKAVKEDALSKIESNEDDGVDHALQFAKSDRTYDFFYYKLILTLTVIGFDYPEILKEMGTIINQRDKVLTKNLKKQWTKSPIKGISYKSWGVLLHSLIDGLVLRAIQTDHFSIDEVFGELELLMEHLNKLPEYENEQRNQQRFGMLKRNNLFY